MRVHHAAALAFAVAVAASPLHAQSASLTLLGYHAMTPAEWVPVPQSSSFRLAQFVLPGRDSTMDAQVVVYFFGPHGGGDVADNLARWHEQFSGAGAPPDRESVTRDSTGAFPITIAEYEGTYRRGIGMGSPDSVRTHQTLVAAIAETPHGTLFLQLFGPDSTVAAGHDAFVRFVKELK